MYTFPKRSFLQIQKRNRRHAPSINIRFGVVSLLMMVVMLFTGVSFLFLTQFNSVSTKGYKLNQLQRDREALLTEHEVHNLLLSEAQSLLTIKGSEMVKRMVNVDPKKITYMKKDTALASR